MAWQNWFFFQYLTKKIEVMWFCTQFFPDCSLRDLGNLHSNSFLGYYNDGYCDDNLNNYVCNFDGGDCCRNTSIFMYCSDCSCIWDVTNYPILTTSNTSTYIHSRIVFLKFLIYFFKVFFWIHKCAICATWNWAFSR